MILKMDTFIFKIDVSIFKIDALSFWCDWAQLKAESIVGVNIY